MSRRGWPALLVGVVIGGCGGPPWYMGRPVRAQPFAAVPQTPSAIRQAAQDARWRCQAVTEWRYLVALHRRDRLRPDDRARLAALLHSRGQAWRRLGRPAAAEREKQELALSPLDAPQTAACPPPQTWEDQFLRGPTVASQLRGDLLPALALPADARGLLADLLMEEDARHPDSLRLAARLYGSAGRWGAAERALQDLVYVSRDRRGAFAVAAQTWTALGQPRRACLAWGQAARLTADVADPVWDRVQACAAADPRFADPQAVQAYRRAAAATRADPPGNPAAAP